MHHLKIEIFDKGYQRQWLATFFQLRHTFLPAQDYEFCKQGLEILTSTIAWL